MIYFDNFQAYTLNYTLDVAEAISAAMNVAGIHETHYDEKQWNIVNGATQGVFTRNNNVITASGSGVLNLFPAGGNVVVDVTMSNDCLVGTGVGEAPSRTSLLRVKLTSAYIEFYGDAATLLSRYTRPSLMTKARVIFWEVVNYKLEISYKIAAVYHGDLLVAAHAVQATNMASATGFYIEAPGVATFNIYASDFSNIALVASVDPGESAASGLSRLILGIPIELLARYDGSVRFYAPATRQVLYNLDAYAKHATGISKSKDYRQLSGMIRAVSALPEAEYLHPDSADKIGAQFKIAQNPNVITFEGAAAEAERTQRRTREAFKTLQLQGLAMPLSEPGDVFFTLDDTWIYDSGDMNIGAEGKFDSRVSARQYQVP